MQVAFILAGVLLASGTHQATLVATTTYSLDEPFATAVLNETNFDRSLHGVANLTWNDTLFQYAALRADNFECPLPFSESSNLGHISENPYGENLAIGYSDVGSIAAWYDEISLYDFAAGEFSEETGHFTQLIWNTTTTMGCAKKYCNSYWGTYVVCEYWPRGNIIGFFVQNVYPLGGAANGTAAAAGSSAPSTAASSSSSFSSRTTSRSQTGQSSSTSRSAGGAASGPAARRAIHTGLSGVLMALVL